MSDAMSHMKAQYFRSVMRTATICSADEARTLIQGLTTELTTANTSADVAAAEAAAFAAVRSLADNLHGRNSPFGGTEWTRTGRAVERWIEVSG